MHRRGNTAREMFEVLGTWKPKMPKLHGQAIVKKEEI